LKTVIVDPLTMRRQGADDGAQGLGDDPTLLTRPARKLVRGVPISPETHARSNPDCR